MFRFCLNRAEARRVKRDRDSVPHVGTSPITRASLALRSVISLYVRMLKLPFPSCNRHRFNSHDVSQRHFNRPEALVVTGRRETHTHTHTCIHTLMCERRQKRVLVQICDYRMENSEGRRRRRARRSVAPEMKKTPSRGARGSLAKNYRQQWDITMTTEGQIPPPDSLSGF